MKATLKDQLLAFREGKYLDSNGKESGCFNFYDWFCEDTSLRAKADRLFKLTEKIVHALRIDIEKHYVFFKNNCLVSGILYDDLRICDIETGDVIWNITPKSGNSRKAELWGIENAWKGAIFIADTPTDLLQMMK